MNTKTHLFPLILFSALALSACGSSGGSSEPPPPPAPMTPPAPPPEPTFEERLGDLAAFDPNDCRAETPGFEALGGWLANDGRELGDSRVWVHDRGPADGPLGVQGEWATHGARVWSTFTDCAVRAEVDQYVQVVEGVGSVIYDAVEAEDRDLILSRSSAPDYEDVPLPEPLLEVLEYWPYWNGEKQEGVQRLMEIRGTGNDDGNRTGWLQEDYFQGLLEHNDTALWILVGGYVGEGEDRGPAGGSSVCGDADPLCLFAPWSGPNFFGTSHATPQVSAALDTVWAVWPDMDILDLRNLAFDCAENMDAREGDTSTERTYSYSNGREFTSTTNSTWGHGILSLTCLFTPNGGLQNPVTGNAISGGIFGPIAGPVTGASITGVDYTGRDFGYGFAYPVARENVALAATANLRPVAAISGRHAFGYGGAAVHGRLWQSGAIRVDLTAAAPPGGAGSAIGAAVQWQAGNMTIRSGIATQPDGVGSLTGSRAFRAPSTLSAAITAAYTKAMPHGFSVHVQADHWRTIATAGRSLWQSARLAEFRFGAAMVKRAGKHEIALQARWQSGLAGSLTVDGRNWPVSGTRDRGVWLTWRHSSFR